MSIARLHFILAGILALLPAGRAHAAYLSCQSELTTPACVTVTGLWPIGVALHLGASCQECTGSGSNVQCSPTEKVLASTLLVETTTGQPVSGAFTQVGTCPIALPQFRFGGTLAAGKQYRVVTNIAPHGKTLLLTFTTTGGTTFPDGGPSVVDGGKRREGGTSSTELGSGTGDGGGSSGDGTGAGGTDDGCSCSLAVTPTGGISGLGALALGLLALGLLLLRRRRRPR